MKEKISDIVWSFLFFCLFIYQSGGEKFSKKGELNEMEENNLYREKTKEIIREFIKSDERCGYEKMQGSSYQGFMYEKKVDESERVMAFDLRLPDEGTLILEAAPGIHVSSKDYLPTVKRYCQENIALNYGAVNVDGDDLQFHIENCLMDNPISKETLEMYEAEAIRVLELHRENLCNLAAGRFLSCASVIENKRVNSNKKVFYGDSIKSIRDFLSNRSNHNAVCEKVDENNNTAFYCQVLTGDESFRLSFILTPDGILVLKGFYGENAFVVPEPYRYAVAEYLNDENARHKYAALSLGANGEGVSCNICTSLLDGIIEDKTIEFMEHIVLKTLSDSIDKIEKLGAGFFVKVDKDDDEMEKLAKMFAESEMGKDFMSALDGCENVATPLTDMMNPFDSISGMRRPATGQVIDSFIRDYTPSDDDELSMSEFADDLGINSSDEEGEG